MDGGLYRELFPGGEDVKFKPGTLLYSIEENLKPEEATGLVLEFSPREPHREECYSILFQEEKWRLTAIYVEHWFRELKE